MLLRTALGKAYRGLIANRHRQIPFWVLVGFLPTFLAARLIVDNAPGVFLQVNGTHVHHFTYGIIMLAITGFVSLVWPWRSRAVLAVAYGIGLALAFDEFGMWLHLTNNYNIDQSEDAMVAILAVLVFLVYGLDLTRRVLHSVYPKKPTKKTP
ncbi:MAG TPA: hypothetical protein VJP80_04645 [Candidatus Saccharimonadales bacterium]|nr:hypothetical protein [Candidatus Saccharimonadales bacterium]